MDIATGCYTAPNGQGTGLRLWRWEAGDLRAARELEIESPSWVGRHPRLPVLYAVTESAQSKLTAFDAGLTELGSVELGGADGCHLAFTADADHAVVTLYSSGALAVVALDRHGVPTHRTDLVDRHGSGPVAGRQEGAHPHQSVLLSDGSLLVCDLGADRIDAIRIDPAGRVQDIGSTPVPPGTGPRHLALTADQRTAYVTGELDSSLLTLHRTGPGWTVHGRVPATEQPLGEPNFPSHLALTADGRHLLVANRGADVITAFDATGSLPRIVAEQPCGRWPRHFSLIEDLVVVAAERADQLTVLSLRGDTLTVIGRIPTGSPTCVLPLS